MWELEEKITGMVKKYLADTNAMTIQGWKALEQLGLDYRCGAIKVSVDGNYVATRSNRSIEYYGGWEYIDASFKMDVGEYCFYDGEASRPKRVIDEVKELLENGWVYDSNKTMFVKNDEQQNVTIES